MAISKKNRQIDRQTDKQTDKQSERHISSSLLPLHPLLSIDDTASLHGLRQMLLYRI